MDLDEKIPQSKYNETAGIYEIDKNPVKVVLSTRALVKKKKKKKEEQSEAFLELTTISDK